jgi:hypothetical protein
MTIDNVDTVKLTSPQVLHLLLEVYSCADALIRYEKEGAPAYCDWDALYDRLKTAVEKLEIHHG